MSDPIPVGLSPEQAATLADAFRPNQFGEMP